MEVTKEFLEQEYKNKSITKIALEIGLDRKELSKIAKSFGIDVSCKRRPKINKDVLENLLNKGFGEDRICKELNVTYSEYRRCIKAYNLKSSHEKFDNSKFLKEVTLCIECNKRPTHVKFCRFCCDIAKKNARKLYFVEKLGGKCSECGYKDCITALDFHHYDDNKETGVAALFSYKDMKMIWKEVQKCKLLCSNCHRKFHKKQRSDKFTTLVQEYYESFSTIDV